MSGYVKSFRVAGRFSVRCFKSECLDRALYPAYVPHPSALLRFHTVRSGVPDTNDGDSRS